MDASVPALRALAPAPVVRWARARLPAFRIYPQPGPNAGPVRPNIVSRATACDDSMVTVADSRHRSLLGGVLQHLRAVGQRQFAERPMPEDSQRTGIAHDSIRCNLRHQLVMRSSRCIGRCQQRPAPASGWCGRIAVVVLPCSGSRSLMPSVSSAFLSPGFAVFAPHVAAPRASANAIASSGGCAP